MKSTANLQNKEKIYNRLIQKTGIEQYIEAKIAISK